MGISNFSLAAFVSPCWFRLFAFVCNMEQGNFWHDCFWNRVHVMPGTIRAKTTGQWYLNFQFLKTFPKLHHRRVKFAMEMLSLLIRPDDNLFWRWSVLAFTGKRLQWVSTWEMFAWNAQCTSPVLLVHAWHHSNNFDKRTKRECYISNEFLCFWSVSRFQDWFFLGLKLA